MDGDGGWGGTTRCRGEHRGLSTQRDQAVHSNRGHMPQHACPTHRSTKNPETNHRLSDNDVPMRFRLQWAHHTLAGCYSGGRCACVVTGDVWKLCTQFNADRKLKLLWKIKTLNFFLLLPFHHIPSLEINTVSFLMQVFSTRSSFAPQETFDNT